MPSALAFVDHRIAELHYQLLDARPDLNPLRVIAAREAWWLDWHVTFFILECV